MDRVASLQALKQGDIAILDIPFDAHSSFLRGAARGPAHIRAALFSDASNLAAEDGTDLGREVRLKFLQEAHAVSDYASIRSAVAAVLERGARLLSLGGDHSITFPVIQAYAGYYPGLQILQLDAHGDLYDSFDGNRYSHACPFARIMEAGLAGRLLQVGVRSLTPHQHEQARRFGVEIIDMREWMVWRGPLPINLRAPLYLSLDLDVLDPAFAPGVSHQEPGGMNTRELIDLIQRLPVPLVGADIVELNPARDQDERSAIVAAKLLKEVLANMLKS